MAALRNGEGSTRKLGQSRRFDSNSPARSSPTAVPSQSSSPRTLRLRRTLDDVELDMVKRRETVRNRFIDMSDDDRDARDRDRSSEDVKIRDRETKHRDKMYKERNTRDNDRDMRGRDRSRQRKESDRVSRDRDQSRNKARKRVEEPERSRERRGREREVGPRSRRSRDRVMETSPPQNRRKDRSLETRSRDRMGRSRSMEASPSRSLGNPDGDALTPRNVHLRRQRSSSRSSPRHQRELKHEQRNSISMLSARNEDQLGTENRKGEVSPPQDDAVARMKEVEAALDAKERNMEKISYEYSGKLAAETNKVKGVMLQFTEPPEARKPTTRWRLYVFKDGEPLNDPLYIHRQAYYLFGRERRVADIPTDHPSCSKQHAVIQYRLTEKEEADGLSSVKVRPYVMDLGSTNGTMLNGERLEPQRYYEMFEKDTIKFGNSSREYVLLHEHSIG